MTKVRRFQTEIWQEFRTKETFKVYLRNGDHGKANCLHQRKRNITSITAETKQFYTFLYTVQDTRQTVLA